MSFISYAQNFEDVMLRRVFSELDTGFYIDVGANDPSADSVTKAFYDRGWCGINIEPLSHHHADLLNARPRDINLCCAAGRDLGSLQIWEADVRGWATADPEVISAYQASGYEGAWHTVDVLTLSEICRLHVRGAIHFLKIDVEGFERPVIEGADFLHYRPWVVLVEATRPNSTEPVFEDWEPVLLNSEYAFVYSDGINRYYLANEHADRAQCFASPPNAFDDFIASEQARYQAHASALQTQLNAAQAQLKAYQSDQQHLVAELSVTKDKLEAVLHSNSWRITEPVRTIVAKGLNIQRWILSRQERIRLKVIYFLLAHPIWRTRALLWIDRLNLSVRAYANLKPKLRPSPGDWRRFIGHPVRARVLPVVPVTPEAALLPSCQMASRWVRFTGHLEGHYSLALVNRELTRALHQLTRGKTKAVAFDGSPYPSPPTFDDPADRPIDQALATVIPTHELKDSVSIVHHYPLINDPDIAGTRGILFFWEETRIPQPTVQRLNTEFDVIWVASNSVKRALMNSGCSTPVFVIRMGVDHVLRHKSAKSAEAPKPSLRRYLHVSSAFERKGIDCLISAFDEAFAGNHQIELYIKTFVNPHNRVHELVANRLSTEMPLPHIRVDDSAMTMAEMTALYQSADAVILPSRGEGFNLPAAEAMALGIPVLTTAHTGHSDFCTQDTALLAKTTWARSTSHLATSDACWLEPDLTDFIHQWRQLDRRLQTNDPELIRMTKAAVQLVRQSYRWTQGAADILTTANWLSHHTPDPSQSLTVTLLSPWDTACGVAEYAASQMDSLLQDPSIRLTVYCDSRTKVAADDVKITWQLGETDGVLELLKSIDRERPDVLVVQHQPSLFRLTPEICQQLARIRQSGTVVLLELHSTQQILREDRLGPDMSGALRELDRIIVHSPRAMNDMFEFGVSDNAMFLPLGVARRKWSSDFDLTRAALSIADDALVLGTFGFAMAHKGIDTLISSLGPLQQQLGRPVHLLAVTAVKDSSAEELISEYQRLADIDGVADRVHWMTEYLPLDVSMRWLGLTDLIVFPYKPTKESASAAVTVGIMAEKPVLVSPLTIFDDVRDVTFELTDDSASAIVQGVTDLLKEPDQIERVRSRCTQWAEDRDWARLSQRMQHLIKALHQNRSLERAIESNKHAVIDDWSQRRSHTLFVDISELYHRDARTGIQRVVRSILLALQADPPVGFRVCSIYADADGMYRVANYAGTSAPSTCEPNQPMDAGPGDVFLGLDLTAHLFPQIEPDLVALQNAGVKLYYVVYDLIPVRYPHYVAQGMTPVFDQWLRSISRHADGLIGISRAVAEDLVNWQLAELPDVPLPTVRYFHLGADFETSAPSTGLPEDASDLMQQIQLKTSFLMVGTLEPRKGHTLVLDAFEMLWAEGVDTNLIWVGKLGWHMDDLESRLRHHVEFGSRLIWIDSATDEFLDTLYQTVDCLIAASETEGFGLPLIEASKYGLPIIASDIPVFREVANHHAYYFSKREPQALMQSVNGWLTLYRRKKHPKSSGLRAQSWQTSAQQLLSAIGLSQS